MTTPSVLALDLRASQTLNDAGQAVLDEFIAAFNARDSQRWAATLNYPHVRLAGDAVTVWNSADDYARSNEIEKLGASGWSHSRWDWKRLIQAAPDKLHFLVSFTRYDSADKPLASYEALYVLTLNDGLWGIQARSSYAGIAVPGAAF